MKNNTAPVQGVRVLRAAIRDYISRIFFSFLNRLFPSLRNYAVPTPAPVELFVTERKLVFTNPLMAGPYSSTAGRQCALPEERKSRSGILSDTGTAFR
ncbi:hypothetical protein [Chlorobium phaeovibrioides]|uniref:hypothetical protein n=1 Tax=Chlorobium phaeovibrioides TaxID=1094 RepID=UPI001CE40122|nr:hypothetical protein [Chlorobium phaeovibrioides]